MPYDRNVITSHLFGIKKAMTVQKLMCGFRSVLDFCTLVSEQDCIGLSVLELLHVIKSLFRNPETWFTLEDHLPYSKYNFLIFHSFFSFNKAFT